MDTGSYSLVETLFWSAAPLEDKVILVGAFSPFSLSFRHPLAPIGSVLIRAFSFLALVLATDLASLARCDAPDLVASALGKPEITVGSSCDPD